MREDPLREKYQNTEVFFGAYIPVFGPEKTPYLATFYAVICCTTVSLQSWFDIKIK